MDIEIRLAVPADAPDIAEIIMRSWEAAYKGIIPDDFIKKKNASRPEQYMRSITEGNAESYVIRGKEKTVGVMQIAPPLDGDVGENFYELHYIYLHPDYFRQGIGAQAMEFAFEKARRLGKTEIIVWVLAENSNSIRFYEKCEFAADGKTKTRDMGKNMECIRMRRRL